MLWSKVQHTIRNRFLTGLAIVFPVGVTLVLLQMLFRWLDGLLAPLARRFTDHPIPGLGIVLTLALIFAVGLFVTNVLGRAFVSFGEHLVDKIPLIRGVYYGAKQLLETLTIEQRTAFTQVVMIEYPHKESYTLGFVTGKVNDEMQRVLSEPFINVFVATTPNPTTGFLLLVPQKDARPLAMSIEDGMKMVVSGGIIQPPAVS